MGKDKLTYEQYEALLDATVMITARNLADRIHQTHYGPNSKHLEIHSCSCQHLALYYLGLKDETGIYWPDGKGGNKWKV